MYFWKIEKLKEDIKNDELVEKDKFIYALIYIVLCEVVLYTMAWIPIEDGNVWDVIDTVINVLIVLVGTIYAYKANGGGAGSDFLGRYFSIGFVVAVRFLVLLIPIMSALALYYFYVLTEDEVIATTAIDVVPIIVWHAALYWRVCKHISDVKTGIKEE